MNVSQVLASEASRKSKLVAGWFTQVVPRASARRGPSTHLLHIVSPLTHLKA